MTFLSSAEVMRRNNVRISGQGTQPLLFAHGFGCDQNMWRYIAPAFEQEYQVVLFDYVGCGHSDISAYDVERYSRLGGYARDIVELIDALDLNDVVLVGHSVSSMIGALAVRERPERFHSVVMIGPSPRYVNDPPYTGGFERSDIEGLLETMDKNYIGWANFLAPVIMQNPDRPELAAELTTSFCSTDPIIARNFAEATFFADNREDLPHIGVPTLVLQCSEDLIAPTTVGEFVAGQLPKGTLRYLDATGHCPHMSHPEETISVMREFLEAVKLQPA
jgi:sigma-B regulation protein RsbQ